MRFELIAYLQKPLHKSCLESASKFILCICEMQKLLQGHENAQARWSLSPHADVRRTNISCADQFIVKHKCDY